MTEPRDPANDDGSRTYPPPYAGGPYAGGPPGGPYAGGPPSDPYAGPPPTGPYAGPYGGPYPGPPAGPGFGDPYATMPPPPNPYAFGPAPYPGYGQVGPNPDARPGIATASVVLDYINAGLLILAGIICFTLASANDALYDLSDGGVHRYTAEFVVLGLLNLAAAGLLIGGAVGLAGRSVTGRLFGTVGAGLVVVLFVYWLARFADHAGATGLLVWGGIFAVLAILSIIFAWTGAGARWLTTKR